ncbi:unnamed protein product [Alopecurus aequalis]
MPSWDDEYSSPSLLGDQTDMDFCPETCEDPTFAGLAVGCEEFCRVHKLTPNQCVAFEGPNIGRRFFMCSVQNQVENCGFVGWVDEEWPDTLQNAVNKLWGVYHASSSARIDEKFENARFVEQLNEEKKKAEKSYSTLVAEVNKFMDETEKRVHKENYKKIMEEGEKSDVVEELRSEVAMLKNVQKSQAEVMKAKEKNWAEEKDALKAEKKKVEYMLFDLLKVSECNKEKLKKIKSICDE